MLEVFLSVERCCSCNPDGDSDNERRPVESDHIWSWRLSRHRKTCEFFVFEGASAYFGAGTAEIPPSPSWHPSPFWHLGKAWYDLIEGGRRRWR